MSELLPFIIIGLTTGAVYGLAGVGLVLTYKTSGIFNFAHGAVAALSAFVYYYLRDLHGVPWPIAVLLSCGVFAAALAFGFELLSRSLGSAPTAVKVLATIGIVLIVLSLGALWFPETPQVAPFLPTRTIEIDGVFVGYDQIIVFAFSIVVTVLLYLFFRLSRLGISMRAVVEDPDLLARTGESAVRVRRWAWVIGSSFAAVSGVALAPDLGLNALALTLLVVQAFGAAAIGGFSSLPLTYGGGLVIGVAGALSTKYTAAYPSLGGLPPAIPFIILVVVLVVTPRRRLVERWQAKVAVRVSSWQAPGSFRAGTGLVVLAVLLVAPLFAGIHLVAYSSALTMAILLLSLSLLVRTSGQVSLGQMAFAAVGAASMAHLVGGSHLPWLVGLMLSALIAAPVGALVAIPAIRLSGTFLAIATLGFGILLEQLVYPLSFMFTTDQSGIATPRPSGHIGGWDFNTGTGFYYVLVLFTVLVALLLQLLRTRPLGRILRAMADSSLAVRTQGSSTRTTLVIAFCLSAFIAGLAGALTASQSQFAAGTDFSSFSSLLLFAVVAVMAFGDPWNALIGAAGLNLIPSYITSSTASTYLQLVFGVAALLYVFASRHPPTVPAALRQAIDRVSPEWPRRRRAVVAAGPVTPLSVRAGKPVMLQIHHLQVRFGGVVAVQDATVEAPAGVVTGLIGPNGAGKTTIFNAVSGLRRPAAGRIFLGDQDLTSLSPEGRARRGLGRTFQQPQLFDSLSVAENVAMGIEAYLVGRNPLRQLTMRRSHRATVAEATLEALDLVGVTELRDVQAGLLSLGQRRLVELARCVAAPFSVLLLDEPSSGLDRRETARFGETLCRLVRERGLGILLVEHDMELVRAICDRVYVLDFGVMIFSGEVAELDTSDVVRAAYLGDALPHPV